MFICKETISRAELLQYHTAFFEDMVKGVVDIERSLLALDAELHADLEALLLDHGSHRSDLWGINLYPAEEELVEFDSLINIRPMQGNRGQGVEDLTVREKILEVVGQWVKE